MAMTWADAVHSAIVRLVATTDEPTFSRQQLIESEGQAMCADVGTAGDTPMQTVSRVLQELRDAGVIEFLDDRGTYRYLG